MVAPPICQSQKMTHYRLSIPIYSHTKILAKEISRYYEQQFGVPVTSVFDVRHLPPGYTSLIVAVSFFGGLQLIVLGIFGVLVNIWVRCSTK
jgi:hypothetical protein